MEWISLKVCPGSHFDGQGDVSHLPTRLAETEAPVLPLCPLRAHSIPIGSRRILTCAPQLPSNLSPLAHQSREHTGTSTPNLEHEAHLLFQEAVCSRLSLPHLFPGFAVLKAEPMSSLFWYIRTNECEHEKSLGTSCRQNLIQLTICIQQSLKQHFVYLKMTVSKTFYRSWTCNREKGTTATDTVSPMGLV